jgi:electron transport complex protein RnfC
VKILTPRYPQGAEKVIVHAVTGKFIPHGKLPSDLGVIVLNVSSVAFINSYLKTGVPLITRRLTISGNAVENPCNVFAPIGTPISSLLSFAEAKQGKVKKVILGGPMMGMCVYSLDSPITKTTNAVLAFTRDKKDVQTACINCARCVNSCPFGLLPQYIERAYYVKDVLELQKLNVRNCMNCGACTYVCPAKRNLAETNQLAKMLL